jgi:hypothetical protein
MAAISHILEITSSWWVTILTGKEEPTHSSRRKLEAGAAVSVPERKKRREGQHYWRKRCDSEVLAGRRLPVGYNKNTMGCGAIKPTVR